jgi:DNA-binding transcriptional ArsR family regulator
MSSRTPKVVAKQKRVPHVSGVGTWGKAAPTFAALGDPTRLSLLSRLSRGPARSISQLTHGSHLTRQAITKHLRVLERAKIVRCVRSGRHALFELDPHPVLELRDYLDRISAQWDEALSRLKSFVEDEH